MNTIPNFDAMNQKELMEFWSKYHRPTRKEAQALIGDRRPGYINITSRLANYACNRSVAMACRERGDIQAASIYEHAMDMCYSDLPEDLKW